MPVRPASLLNAGVTSKLTVKLWAVTEAPDTVTVAVYWPTGRPAFGTTVKLSLPPAAKSLTAVFDRVKSLAFAPLSARLNAPVEPVPVLFTVTLKAAGAT
ncbi:hypothetical protein D3C75_872520 [compost metagenome]